MYMFFCIPALVSGVVNMNGTVSNIHESVGALCKMLERRKNRSSQETPVASSHRSPGKRGADMGSGFLSPPTHSPPKTPRFEVSPSDASGAGWLPQRSETEHSSHAPLSQDDSATKSLPDRQNSAAEHSMSRQLGEALTTVYGPKIEEEGFSDCCTCGRPGASCKCPGCLRGVHSNSKCGNEYQLGYACLTCYAVSDHQFVPGDTYSQPAVETNMSQEPGHTPPHTYPPFPPGRDSGHSVILIESSPEQIPPTPTPSTATPAAATERKEIKAEASASPVENMQAAVLTPVENMQVAVLTTPAHKRTGQNSKAVPRKSNGLGTLEKAVISPNATYDQQFVTPNRAALPAKTSRGKMSTKQRPRTLDGSGGTPQFQPAGVDSVTKRRRVEKPQMRFTPNSHGKPMGPGTQAWRVKPEPKAMDPGAQAWCVKPEREAGASSGFSNWQPNQENFGMMAMGPPGWQRSPVDVGGPVAGGSQQNPVLQNAGAGAFGARELAPVKQEPGASGAEKCVIARKCFCSFVCFDFFLLLLIYFRATQFSLKFL